MNLVGKIFVFLNLFLAVAVMAFCTMVYATHKNIRAEIDAPKTGWKDQYNELYKKNKSLEKQRQELLVQINAETIARERALAAAESHRQTLVGIVQQLKATLVDKDKALADSTQSVTQAQANLKTAKEAEDQVTEAMKLAAKENDERFKRLISITNELNTVAAAIPNLKERATQLAQDYARAKLLLEKLGRTPQDPISLEPPPVTGTVLAVGRLQDPNLVELSLGKDDGIRDGHYVDLYRGNVYLGRGVITETQGHRAVAKVLKDGLRQPVRQDDSFTTRLQYMTSQMNTNTK
jgi:hypothetical protein